VPFTRGYGLLMCGYGLLMLSRSRFIAAFLAAGVALVLLFAAAPAFADTATVTLSPSTVTPATSPPSQPANLVTTVNFGYADAGTNSATDSVSSTSVVLPPGMWASLGNISPGDQVGTASSTIIDAGIPVPASGTVSLESVPAGAPSNAIAGIQLSLTAVGLVDVTVNGYIEVNSDAGQPYLELVIPSIPDSAAGGLLSFQISALTLTLDGSVNGAPFLRYPTADGNYPISISYSTYDGYSGSGTGNLAVSDSSSLNFGPSISANLTEDAADSGVAVNTTISAASTDSALKDATLTFPPSSIGPNPSALPMFGSGKPVGSATLVTPLLPNPGSGSGFPTNPVTGVVTLNGSIFDNPTLTVTVGAPFNLTLSGAISLATDSVIFSSIPDIPITSLEVSLNGGPEALFSTEIDPSGPVKGSFTGWNGATTAPSSTFTIAGFRAPHVGLTEPSTPLPAGTVLKAASSVRVGTMLASGVTVTANHGGSLTINDKGTKVSVPRGDSVVSSSRGVVVVTSGSGNSVSYRIVLPKGTSAKKFSLRLPAGVSFGAHSSSSAIKSLVTVSTTAGKKLGWSVTKVSKAHNQIWLKTAKAEKTLDVKLKASKLTYTSAEKASLKKRKRKTITPSLTVTPTKGRSATFRIPTTV